MILRSLALLLVSSVLSATARADELHVPAGHATISAAVAAAGAGDVILVAAGTYQENVVVDAVSDLTIEGLGKVFVDGSGATPLTVRNGSADVTLINLRAVNPGATGIDVDASDHVRVLKCRVTGATADGVHVHGGGTAALVRDCTVVDCVDGIEVEDDRGHYFANHVARSTGTGISLTGAAMNVVEKNKVVDDGANGVQGINVGFSSVSAVIRANVVTGMQIGLRATSSCQRVVFSENKVTGVTATGILAGCDGNFVTRNTVIGAGTTGINVSSADGIFEENHVTGSGGHGMYAWDGALTATNNVLRGNRVAKSAMDGIHIDDAGNVVVGNRVKKSGGVDLEYQGAAATTVVFKNKLKTVLP